MSITAVVVIVGMINGLLIGLGVLFRKEKKANNLLFAFTLFVLVLVVNGMLLHEFDAATKYPYIHFLFHSFYLLLTPVFYLYGNSLMVKDFKISYALLIHAIPFFSILIIGILLDMLGILSLVDMAIPKVESSTKYLSYAMYFGGLLQFSIYITLLVKNLSRYRKMFFETISDFERRSIKWLETLVVIIIVIYICEICFGILLTGDVLSFSDYSLLMAIVFTGFILYIGFVGITQSGLYIGLIEEKNNEMKPISEKYSQSSLPNETLENMFAELELLMNKEQPFLNQDLTIGKLADILQTKPHHLSQTINTKTGTNFFNFINGYRIEAAKKRLIEEYDVTILSVAEESGFSSKTAFNAAFKKFTGITPSQFRKEQS